MKFTKREVTQKVMMEYAIKGLEHDIEKLDNKIKKGNEYINNRLEGNRTDKSPLSIEGLKKQVRELEIEKATLESMKADIKWDLTDYS